MRLIAIAIVSTAALAAATTAPPGRQEGVPYPEGYREWTHVKSMVIERGHPLYDSFGGIHHVYANPRAAARLKAGGSGPFPDGSVFVFDLLAAVRQEGAIVEGDRKFIGVMVKDAARYGDTGGWGFAAFKGSTREAANVDAAACFACHRSAEENDFVFTAWRR